VRPTLWTTATATGGAISITARPRPGDWLADEMTALRTARVDALISALTDAEARELGLTSEPTAARAAGLGFASLPIPDLGVPAATASFLTALGPLAALVEAGGHVAVHCRASIGRSGIIATLLLVHAGWDPESAMAHLSTLRGTPVPETDQQRTWLLDTATTLKRQPPSTGATQQQLPTADTRGRP
jgi:protein-tyrosine phosphatase